MMRGVLLFSGVALLFIFTGVTQSWNTSLTILNMAVVSAIMAMGVNMQWGYAGLFNVGVMGFVALGGLGVVLSSTPPVAGAMAAGGWRILLALLVGAAAIGLAVLAWRRLAGRMRGVATTVILILGFVVFRALFDPGVAGVEAINPTLQGNLGGLGLPVLLAWPIGGALAAAAAWAIGKTALGLRSDYLAIATLGIAEIILSVMRNEEWLARGVKNVIGLPRPVPYEVALQQNPAFIHWATGYGFDIAPAAAIVVKLCYLGLFVAVLAAIMLLAELALRSPWGRMMRAIRDNEAAAGAMGKDVKARHLQIFVLGAVVLGIAGAMMTTLDSQLTPSSYQPLRYTFLIWVMVIVGGSGNNWGAMLGGFLIWWLWVMVEPIGTGLLTAATDLMADGWLKTHLRDGMAHIRLLTMGVILLVVLRFHPRGLLPER
ncbi:branched-chain amino acid ABC transporter permease [Falsirhodobacter halotolerans]|uniref:branched-chain amino acid ABC transporter permease n=1 Tax=Falsirhodobacter halotolerans TaxID=1146892 RepID=UPI001FD529B3|nr:branched-chain amino acid ABC transporter permease [Falsirhodobacter halotolerans]MCJ8139432.1 branched-chain amino acid ABC transporter permease [Falsirhodobacter halotolerans]